MKDSLKSKVRREKKALSVCIQPPDACERVYHTQSMRTCTEYIILRVQSTLYRKSVFPMVPEVSEVVSRGRLAKFLGLYVMEEKCGRGKAVQGSQGDKRQNKGQRQAKTHTMTHLPNQAPPPNSPVSY